ncbi:MAG: YibE/F family protein [Oscillospiraceae bacterium]|nr:YibE/F family protein [Oscillospiraceae bacterium]
MKLKLTLVILTIISIIAIGSSVFAIDDQAIDYDWWEFLGETDDIFDDTEFEPGEVIITFDDSFSDTDMAAMLALQRVSARVVEVRGIITRESGMFSDREETLQLLVVEILEGELEGQRIEATHFLAGDQEQSMGFDALRVGDRAYVAIDIRGDTPTAYIDLVQRQNGLIILIAIFLVLILIIGRLKGVQTIASLVVTLGIIFLFTLPSLLDGRDPVLISVLSCIAITIICFLVISGLRKKTAAAIIGTTCGFAIAGVLAIVFASVTRMSGLNGDSVHLMFIEQETTFNLVGLMFAGIIIGALGVCMDVAMSIASSLWELKKESPKISRKALFTAGMNIGKDAMATMSNTLILAYVGSLITIILLFMANNTEFSHIINIEMMTEEVIKGVTGSIGLITVIPITSYISALLYCSEKESNTIPYKPRNRFKE